MSLYSYTVIIIWQQVRIRQELFCMRIYVSGNMHPDALSG